MATIKLKFRTSSKDEKEGTLCYQVIHKRNVRWITTRHRIRASEWNHRTSSITLTGNRERDCQLRLIQSSVIWEMEQRKRIIRQMETETKDYTIEMLFQAFEHLPECVTMFDFMHKQIDRKREMKRFGTARTYANTLRSFRKFRGDNDLTFTELTQKMMEQYEAWMTHRGLKQNSIRFYLRTLNTLTRKAIDEHLMEDRQLFAKVRLSYVKTTKRAITESQIRRIERLDLSEKPAQALARDMFMFSFYMRGMSFVDMAFLRKADLKYGMLSYCRRKTNQHLTIAWHRALQDIIDRYTHLTRNTPYLLPIITRTDGTEYKQYRNREECINRALKSIGVAAGLKIPLTTYVARHSWASIARNMNFSIAIISEGMGHQSYRTTQIYLDSIDTARIDDANNRIIRRISMGK